jgi:hypothetical protein
VAARSCGLSGLGRLNCRISSRVHKQGPREKKINDHIKPLEKKINDQDKTIVEQKDMIFRFAYGHGNDLYLPSSCQ